MTPPSTADAHVPTIAGLALQGFLSAASLHLGETASDGTRIEQADPQEAWKALLAADALLKALGPLAHADFRQAQAHLARRLAERHPTSEFPLPLREDEA